MLDSVQCTAGIWLLKDSVLCTVYTVQLGSDSWRILDCVQCTVRIWLLKDSGLCTGYSWDLTPEGFWTVEIWLLLKNSGLCTDGIYSFWRIGKILDSGQLGNCSFWIVKASGLSAQLWPGCLKWQVSWHRKSDSSVFEVFWTLYSCDLVLGIPEGFWSLLNWPYIMVGFSIWRGLLVDK